MVGVIDFSAQPPQEFCASEVPRAAHAYEGRHANGDFTTNPFVEAGGGDANDLSGRGYVHEHGLNCVALRQ